MLSGIKVFFHHVFGQSTEQLLGFFCLFCQGVELLVCDLLLTLRTSLWQRCGSSNGEPGPAHGAQLAGFQRDLSALRRLTQCYRQAQHKVRLVLQENQPMRVCTAS